MPNAILAKSGGSKAQWGGVSFALAEQDSIHPAFLAMTALFRKLLEADDMMDISFHTDGLMTVVRRGETLHPEEPRTLSQRDGS